MEHELRCFETEPAHSYFGRGVAVVIYSDVYVLPPLQSGGCLFNSTGNVGVMRSYSLHREGSSHEKG